MPNHSPDWEAMRNAARAGVGAPDWPTQVRQISLEGLGLLGIDAAQRLYWDGKRIEIRRRLALSRWQKLGAFLVVAATVAGGVGAAVQAAVAVADFGCQRGLWHRWCPVPVVPPHRGVDRPG